MDLPRTLIHRYRLERLIGAGSSADTYLATDLACDQPVAVKVLRAPIAGDPAAPVRFTREVRAAAAVDHPQVVRLRDAGYDGATRFIVMEAVLGSSLKAHIDAAAPLSIDQALGLTTQILNGLAAIHDAGIIHRDIKPQNVLVDAHGHAKLTDFGIAHRPTDAGLTETGITLGSAAYMAPEQALGEPLTPAADLYAVGIILFELLTGRTPFLADHPLGVLYQQVHQAPPSVRACNPSVPGVLDGVVARALAKDPRQRYPSAPAMRGVLDAVAASPEIRIPPAGRRESPRLITAHRGTTRFLVTAGVVTLLLLASMVVVTLRSGGHDADLAAGLALATSRYIGPQTARSALTLATPTPTATAAPFVPPPIHTVMPVVPGLTAPPPPAVRPTATAVPRSTPQPTPIVTLRPTPAPQPSPTIVPSPTPVSHAVPVSMPAARTGTAAVSPVAAPSPTATVAPSPAATPAPSPTPTPTPAPSPTPTPTLAPTPSPAPTPTPVPAP